MSKGIVYYNHLLTTLDRLCQMVMTEQIHRVTNFWTVIRSCIMDTRKVYTDSTYSFMLRRYIVDMIIETLNMVIIERGSRLVKLDNELGMVLQIGDPDATIRPHIAYIKCMGCGRYDTVHIRPFDDVHAPCICDCECCSEFRLFHSCVDLEADANDQLRIYELLYGDGSYTTT